MTSDTDTDSDKIFFQSRTRTWIRTRVFDQLCRTVQPWSEFGTYKPMKNLRVISESPNKPENTLIQNFEWLRLGMTETITSEDLSDILSGTAQFHIL